VTVPDAAVQLAVALVAVMELKVGAPGVLGSEDVVVKEPVDAAPFPPELLARTLMV
jgi:hypothetical protein